jgi:M6 family metalloprotease-like protein
MRALFLGAAVLASTAYAYEPGSFGEKRAAVILANFSNEDDPNTTPDQIRTLFSGTIRPFYLENSYNKADLVTTVYGWYTMTIPATCPGTDAAFRAILQGAADAAGDDIDFRQQTTVIVILPLQTPTFFCGLSGKYSSQVKVYETDGSYSYVDVVYANSAVARKGLLHEIGHLFGAGHANLLKTCTANPYPAGGGQGCTVLGYGDLTSVMGSIDRGHLTAPQKHRIGWVDTNLVDVTSGTYVLEPFETIGTGTKVLKIRRSADQAWYVAYRQPIGFDAFMGSESTETVEHKGAYIYLDKYVNPYDSSLVDPTGTASSTTATLRVGQSYSDPSAGLTISVLSRTTTSLTVRVDRSAPVDTTPPVISAVSPAAGTISGTVSLTASTAAYQVTYSYFRGLVEPLSPTPIGSSGTSPYSVSWNTAAIANGDVTVITKAIDAVGNSSRVTTRYTIQNAGDVTPPTITMLYPAAGQVLPNSIMFGYQAADNNQLSKVEFWRNTGSTPFLTHQLSSASVLMETIRTTFTDGSYTVWLKAYDLAGNVRETPHIGITAQLNAPPQIRLPLYLESMTLKGTYPVSAKVSGTNLSQVKFYRDTGVLLGTVTSFSAGSANFYWNTTQTANGAHRLYAVAYNTRGQVTTSNTVNVVIQN